MADITVYYVPTPNGKKITLALEELGLNYDIKWINIMKGDQFTEEYKKINPNSKIPAIVDHTENDLAVFESGAILEYLAEKTGKLGGTDLASRYAVKQWIHWQIGGLGPVLGQLNHFLRREEKIEVALERYTTEALRLFAVLDKQLEGKKYITGDEYTIADICCYWWTAAAVSNTQAGEQFQKFENVKRWLELIGEREAVANVLAIKME